MPSPALHTPARSLKLQILSCFLAGVGLMTSAGMSPRIALVGNFKLADERPLSGLLVSERSGCGAMHFYVTNESSAGIVRVGSLWLWRRCCEARACWISIPVVTYELLRHSRSLCGITRVRSLWLWRRANFKDRRRTLCVDRESVTWPVQVLSWLMLGLDSERARPLLSNGRAKGVDQNLRHPNNRGPGGPNTTLV